MTDKELLQQWIKPYAIVPVTMDATRIIVDALRETLANPKKEWVGLTDEERNACLVEADPCEALLEHEAWQLMRDIEAKLKEKNT